MKIFNIIQSFEGKVTADINLKANSFEKALISAGANKPQLFYSSRGLRSYQDRNNWIFNICEVVR